MSAIEPSGFLDIMAKLDAIDRAKHAHEMAMRGVVVAARIAVEEDFAAHARQLLRTALGDFQEAKTALDATFKEKK